MPSSSRSRSPTSWPSSSPSRRTSAWPEAIVDALVAHAREAAPRECVGLLAGRDGRTLEVVALPNRARHADRFEVDPRAVLRALRALHRRGLVVTGVYHSHPDGDAEPSPADLAAAREWPGVPWVIVGLGGADASVRAFAPDGERYSRWTIR